MSEKELLPEQGNITLPRDYDVYHPGLNQDIQNLLRQVIAAKDAQHAAELSEIVESYKERLSVAETASSELAERCRTLTEDRDRLEDKVDALESEVLTARERAAEAEFKRDNAVRIAEEAEVSIAPLRAENDRLKRSEESLKEQINELEGMLRTYKSTKPSGGIQLTSILPDVSEEELKARKERERIEGLNKVLERRGIEPLAVPPLPSVDSVTEEAVNEQMERVAEAAVADADTFPVVSDDTGAEAAESGAEETAVDAGDAGEEADEALSLEDQLRNLEHRVSYLERWKESAEVRLVDLMG